MSSDAALKNEASFLLCVLKIKEILKVTPFITMKDIIYSYFIKNPVCIYDGSLDYHLYPLRVIFIRVTVVTLKTRQKHQFEFSQLLSLNILCIPCFFSSFLSFGPATVKGLSGKFHGFHHLLMHLTCLMA